MKFAKLFELENNEQVLITISCDRETDEYKLTITIYYENKLAEMVVSNYKTEVELIDSFETITLENASKLREIILLSIKQNSK